ncbi:MAG TPA: rhomboid family intramembrane serine protease [Pseudolabrys sp.]
MALAVVHAVRTLLLTDIQDNIFLGLFAFVPSRYDTSIIANDALPGGVGAEIWTFVTYSLIHADWMHFGVNSLWLLPFGSALARRFGAIRFLAFFAVTAAAGAAMHLATHAGEQFPVIGASASVSGAMAAAMRFAFQQGGPLNMMRTGDDRDYRVPAIPLAGMFSDARVLMFVGVWFAINIIFGVGSFSITGGEQSVAWQAHIGGFLAGLLLFTWFDPPGTSTAPPLQYDDAGPDDSSATRH